MKYTLWVITALLFILFFWLYKKKKVSGKKATLLFFIVKGTISTSLIIFGMFSLWMGTAHTENTEISILASPLSNRMPSPRLTELSEENHHTTSRREDPSRRALEIPSPSDGDLEISEEEEDLTCDDEETSSEED